MQDLNKISSQMNSKAEFEDRKMAIDHQQRKHMDHREMMNFEGDERLPLDMSHETRRGAHRR